MYGEIVAAVNSLKAASDIGKALLSIHTTAEVQGKAIELNQIIIDAQQSLLAAHAAQSTLVDEVRDLKSQIAAMKDWDAQKQRYQLASPNTGSFVYALKKDMAHGEPPHYLCANCFKQGKASIVNDMPSKRRSNDHAWTCPVCGSEALNGYSGPSPVHYAEEIAQQ